MYSIIFLKSAEKFIRKLDKKQVKEIFNKIEMLKKFPQSGEPLSGALRGLWRLRVGKYRIIYQIKNEELIVYVLNIGHRKNIYL